MGPYERAGDNNRGKTLFLYFYIFPSPGPLWVHLSPGVGSRNLRTGPERQVTVSVSKSSPDVSVPRVTLFGDPV